MTDRTGEKYGFLVVEKFAGRTTRGMLIWLCRCKCGEKVSVRYGNLQSGHTTSCGCQKAMPHPNQLAAVTKHGHSSNGMRTPEYRSYSSAKERCRRQKHHKFPSYGAAGIKFLFNSFEEFFAELGPRPKGTTCDRWPNPAGHYEAGNVRWATSMQQRHNRRIQNDD